MVRIAGRCRPLPPAKIGGSSGPGKSEPQMNTDGHSRRRSGAMAGIMPNANTPARPEILVAKRVQGR